MRFVCRWALLLALPIPAVANSSQPLNVPAAGKTGFTALAPEQTGIAFTNSLEEWQGASNRVLFNGSGVATGDFDNDGLPDIYFCSLNGRNTLYRNLGGWKFADVTEQAGLKRDNRFYRAAVFADINGDASLDLLVCVIGGGVQCWVNDGRGRFTDGTTAARTGSRFGSITLALADVDGNGALDLYVANNRTDDIRDRGQVQLRMVGGQMTVPPELSDRLVVVNGEVLEYGEPDQLLMNDGRGRFSAVSWTGGRFHNEEGQPLTQPPLDWALAAMFRDVNNDGAPDLYVCNDFWTPDRFWLNDGKGRFTAAPRLTLRNMSASSMGVDFADIDRDGDVDFFVVDMLSRELRLRKRQKLAQKPMAQSIGAIDNRPQFMRNTLFVNRGDGTFAEIANYSGVAASDWSWSPVFMDVDLDGYEDLLITAGHAKDVQDMDAQREIQARQHSWKGFTNEVERQKAFTKELMEHMRFYPALDMPLVAFRNKGNLQFEETTQAWGTEQRGVHHAIALADFDRDGDLDFVVNRLGSAAGIYRNESAAPRVAVRLRGFRPNIQGIGAKVALRGGAVPLQSQEVIAGGRYMAGSEPLVVFAAGNTTNAMTLEVTWRTGKQSFVSNIVANRVYEVEEESATPSLNSGPSVKSVPLFHDFSHLLRHTHTEEPFNDFERQPLLPRRLSQLGPGLSCFDLDADGDDDLLIGSGRGGKLACYRNNGSAGLQRVTEPPFDVPITRDQTTILGSRGRESALIFAGSANYEDGVTNEPSVRLFQLGSPPSGGLPGDSASPGPLALADVDADGDLDLFVGGRVIPGRYPEPASSRMFRWSDRFEPDNENNQTLQNVGLVCGAVFSDLTGDGLPELILACEWGPITIFRNERGQFSRWNPAVKTVNHQPSTINELAGWWNGVTTGDFDNDGRLDIAASNWGLNGEHSQVELYYADFLDRGVVDLIEAESAATRRGLDVLGRQLPPLLERFATHRKFSEAPLNEVLSVLNSQPSKVSVTTLASTIFLNRGDHFELRPLPAEAQWAPAFAINAADFDGDGYEDLFLGQNFFATAPETPRFDAGRGLLLRGNGSGSFEPMPAQQSGIEVYGEQRGAATADLDGDARTDLVVTQNGAATKLFRNASAKPGLRVRLVGPPGNPHGIGATLRLATLYSSSISTNWGPAREIHAGSGYWSQDSAVAVMALSSQPSTVNQQLWVRWPGGQVSTIEVPVNATQISVTNAAANVR